ncbi:MAG TPA: response regulator transcription factor [Peptococcaceae bacterium]|nr:response regulator transcription factor [Peptococcaceae bacterium]
MKSPIKLLLVDDHTVLRSGLRMLLNSHKDIVVVGEAESGEEALEKIKELKPDIVLLDISMPGMGGMTALQKIKEISEAKVLMLTMHADEEYLKEALEFGVSGYVLKQAADTELIQAIKEVANGQVHVDSGLAQNLVKSMYHPSKQKNDSDSNLTDREKEVLKLIALGHTNKEIAETLMISVKTVESHKTRIMEKINCQKRSEMVRYALENGYINT